LKQERTEEPSEIEITQVLTKEDTSESLSLSFDDEDENESGHTALPLIDSFSNDFRLPEVRSISQSSSFSYDPSLSSVAKDPIANMELSIMHN